MRLPWAVLLLALLTGRYLHWRITATLNLTTPLAGTLSLLLLAAELWLQAHGLLLQLFTLAPEAPRPADAPAQRQQGPSSAALPWVDVLVPSYGEPLEVVERCLRGCRALAYPAFAVWLLDDSGRPELQALCERLGCRYRQRERREHAKAGNLNHVLPELSGELVAVFDADVVPVESFLERTAGRFEDPAVGLVQTPQTYMNADPVIRNLALERWLLPDEESFYRWIEPVRQRLDAVVCAGTSFVVRRQALLAVGGFETGTPSEDLATGIRLTAAGWRCLFVAEKLSAGLAPLSAAALVRQRCRWAGGTLQTLRTGANPLRIAGLNPLQRLAFLEGILHWFNVLPQLVLLLMSLSLGVLGVAPLQVSGAGLLQAAVPLVAAQLLLARWISGQSRTALMPELYRWLVLLPLAGAVLGALLGRPQPFRVTPKALAVGRRRSPEPKLLLPLLALLSLQVVALLNLLPAPLGLGARRPALEGISSATLAVVLAWGLLNALLLLAALRCCHDRARSSAIPWLAWGEAVTLNGRPARLTALSEAGAELQLQAPLNDPPGSSLELVSSDGQRWPLQLERREGLLLGGRWGDLSELQRDALHRRLYRRPGQWPVRRAPAEPLALLALLLRLLRPRGRDSWFRRSLMPVIPVGVSAPAHPSRTPPGP
jgi:cellulose synthase (UDP-forming)